MKNVMAALVLSVSVLGINFAQESQPDTGGVNLYTVFVNSVNEQFRLPLIGFVNIAGGNHRSPQIGFINWNQGDFGTLQLGFVNTSGGGMTGFQTGFVNTVARSFKGVQFGFVNTAAGDEAHGLQVGFVNTAARRLNGTQLSFVNYTKQLCGIQFGFINYSGSIEEGMPVGFLSIVRNGGYRATELGSAEIAPFNLSLKIGVERLYTSFAVGFNPSRDGIREQILWGAGFGSIVRLGRLFYLNPEIMAHNGIDEDFQHYVSVAALFGLNIMPGLSLTAGPSVVWVYNGSNAESPFCRIMEYSVNEENKLYAGARIALRFHW